MFNKTVTLHAAGWGADPRGAASPPPTDAAPGPQCLLPSRRLLTKESFPVENTLCITHRTDDVVFSSSPCCSCPKQGLPRRSALFAFTSGARIWLSWVKICAKRNSIALFVESSRACCVPSSSVRCVNKRQARWIGESEQRTSQKIHRLPVRATLWLNGESVLL